MRRAPHEEQKPRVLQLNATSFSAWQSLQRRRMSDRNGLRIPRFSHWE
jgi:hypothetical protein